MRASTLYKVACVCNLAWSRVSFTCEHKYNPNPLLLLASYPRTGECMETDWMWELVCLVILHTKPETWRVERRKKMVFPVSCHQFFFFCIFIPVRCNNNVHYFYTSTLSERMDNMSIFAAIQKNNNNNNDDDDDRSNSHCHLLKLKDRTRCIMGIVTSVCASDGGTCDQIILFIVYSICVVCERKAFNNLKIMSEWVSQIVMLFLTLRFERVE